MQLIKSLLCWHGFDNRNRFILISLSCLLVFIMLNAGLTDYKSSAIVVLLLCSSIWLATTRRRVNDAAQDKKWLLVPTASFLITGLMIIFIGHIASYGLLLVPLLLALLLLTYPSKNQKQYILGYSGPVNLADFKPVKKLNSGNNQRVEPTMNSINVAHPSLNKSQHSSLAERVENTSSTTNTYQSTNNTQHKHDIGETIRLALFSPKYVRITFAIISLLFVLALLLSLAFSNSPSAQFPQAQTSAVKEVPSDFQHQLTLPDNFSIMTSPDKGIVIHWQADVKDNREIWALATATGDNSCQDIAFNKGEVIRTYRVSVMDRAYYAYFSPLDTKALIKNIAFKNTFALCGYKFSLKGSQATLGKSIFYASLIEY